LSSDISDNIPQDGIRNGDIRNIREIQDEPENEPELGNQHEEIIQAGSRITGWQRLQKMENAAAKVGHQHDTG